MAREEAAEKGFPSSSREEPASSRRDSSCSWACSRSIAELRSCFPCFITCSKSFVSSRRRLIRLTRLSTISPRSSAGSMRIKCRVGIPFSSRRIGSSDIPQISSGKMRIPIQNPFVLMFSRYSRTATRRDLFIAPPQFWHHRQQGERRRRAALARSVGNSRGRFRCQRQNAAIPGGRDHRR